MKVPRPLTDFTVITDRLSKRYGSFVALHDCSLQAEAGEVLGLLGPNGAGKTTLLRILLGFLKPSAGSARIMGVDAIGASVLARQSVAYLPAEAKFPGNFRANEVLEMWAGLHSAGNLEKSRQLTQRLDLDSRCRVSRMSTGMRQKLGLCVVLSINAPVVILDEPTANLDPSIRAEVLALVREAKQENRTVIFSNHVLSEIEDTCDRVVLLRRGELVRETSLHHLRQRFRMHIQTLQPLPPLPLALQDTRTISCNAERSDMVLETANDLTDLLGWLATASPTVLRVEPMGLADEYRAVHQGKDDS